MGHQCSHGSTMWQSGYSRQWTVKTDAVVETDCKWLALSNVSPTLNVDRYFETCIESISHLTYTRITCSKQLLFAPHFTKCSYGTFHSAEIYFRSGHLQITKLMTKIPQIIKTLLFLKEERSGFQRTKL